jgi:hypothetical protein
MDDRRIEHRPLLEQQTLLAQALVDALEHLVSNLMLFQQVPEVQNRGLIRNPAIDQIDPCKAAKAGGIDQHLLHQRVRQREPLLQQMDSRNLLAQTILCHIDQNLIKTTKIKYCIIQLSVIEFLDLQRMTTVLKKKRSNALIQQSPLNRTSALQN